MKAEGTDVPFLFMVKFDEIQAHIEGLLNEKFEEPTFESCFTVEVKNTGGNKIQVFIDDDEGVDFNLCKQISRYLEDHLDEHPLVPEKYVLEVSSPGVDRPLTRPRQYKKHVGRKLKVKLSDGKRLKGVLKEVGENGIKIERKIKKQKTTEETMIPYDRVSSAEVLITFNK